MSRKKLLLKVCNAPDRAKNYYNPKENIKRSKKNWNFIRLTWKVITFLEIPP